MVKVGETYDGVLGLGSIHLVAGEKVIHVHIEGFGTVLCDLDLPPENAEIFCRDTLGVYNKTEDIVKSTGFGLGQEYIDSGKKALTEVQEWISQVTGA